MDHHTLSSLGCCEAALSREKGRAGGLEWEEGDILNEMALCVYNSQSKSEAEMSQ